MKENRVYGVYRGWVFASLKIFSVGHRAEVIGCRVVGRPRGAPRVPSPCTPQGTAMGFFDQFYEEPAIETLLKKPDLTLEELLVHSATTPPTPTPTPDTPSTIQIRHFGSNIWPCRR